MGLPVITGPEDVVAIVQQLGKRPTGKDLVRNLESVLGPKATDGRKLSALEAWGFIVTGTGEAQLADLGEQLKGAPPSEYPSVYGDAIRRVEAYAKVLEWLNAQNTDQVTAVEIGSYWHKYCTEAVGTTSDKSLTDMANCFFRLAEGAMLGKRVQGRRGKPTRFDINKTAIASFVKYDPLIQAPTENEAETQDLKSSSVTDEGKTVVHPRSATASLAVNINIQLTMPDDPSVYDKFFEAMKKHLLTPIDAGD